MNIDHHNKAIKNISDIYNIEIEKVTSCYRCYWKWWLLMGSYKLLEDF